MGMSFFTSLSLDGGPWCEGTVLSAFVWWAGCGFLPLCLGAVVGSRYVGEGKGTYLSVNLS